MNIFKKVVALTASFLLCLGATGCIAPSEGDNTGSGGCRYHMDDNEDGICDVCGTDLQGENELGKVNGWYIMENRTVSSVDKTDAYVYSYLHLENGSATWSELDVTGNSISNGSYSVKDNKVTVTIGIKPYEFEYDATQKSLSFSGTLNKKKVTMKFVAEENYQQKTDKGSVDFTSELFGDDLSKNFYNYCPTVMVEGNTMHIWYCANIESGKVIDRVCYRKGTLHSDGKWTFGEKQVALEPTADGVSWDCKHTCDPTVVKGDFNYNGTKYSYLMAYLGCRPGDVNEVGIAVSNDPATGWVKVNELNPICGYLSSSEYAKTESGGDYWGYGQPSLVSVDKAGKVILFYTKGIKLGTYTYAEMWDLSNLNAPIKMKEGKLSDGGDIGVFNNADFAYDPVSKNFYVVKEDHINGWYPEDGGVNWISGSNSVYRSAMSDSDENVGDSLFNSSAWSKVGTIAQSNTGFARNHNSGIVTDPYGWIINNENIPVIYTKSDLKTDYPDWDGSGQWPALHTYRLYGYNIKV